MPPALVAILPALIGLGTAGVTTGLELSGALQPGAPKASSAQQAASVAQQQNALKATIASQAPNYQAEAEGGLSPNYIAQQIGSNTGTLGNLSSLQDILKGGGGGGGGGSNLPQGNIGPAQVGQTPQDSKGLTDLTSYLAQG